MSDENTNLLNIITHVIGISLTIFLFLTPFILLINSVTKWEDYKVETEKKLREEAKVEKFCIEKSKVVDTFIEEKFLSDKDYFFKLENGQISNIHQNKIKIGDELCIKETTKVTFFGDPAKKEEEIKSSMFLVSSYVDEIKKIEDGNLVLIDSYNPAIEEVNGNSYKLYAEFTK